MKTAFKGPSGVLEYQRQPSGVSDQGWLPLTAGWVGVSHKKRGNGWCSGSRRESARLGVWGCPGKRHRMAWGWDKTKNGLVGVGEGVRMDTALWGAVRAGLDRGARTYWASPRDVGFILEETLRFLNRRVEFSILHCMTTVVIFECLLYTKLDAKCLCLFILTTPQSGKFYFFSFVYTEA